MADHMDLINRNLQMHLQNKTMRFADPEARRSSDAFKKEEP